MSMNADATVRTLEWCLRSSRSGKREAFMQEGKRIMQFSQRHTSPENPEYDKDEYWATKITKTAEARQLFGNAMYQQNPVVAAVMKATAPAANAEADVMVDYLTVSMKETHAEKQRKRAVDQAVTWGRGVVHTLLDAEDKVTSRWYPVKDHYQDPDALSADEVRWMGRWRYSLRSELTRKFPKKKAVIADLDTVSKTEGDANAINSGSNKGDERVFTHDPCDVVEWYVLYFKEGLHNFRGGLLKGSQESVAEPDTANPEDVELSNGAKRYVVALNGERMVLLDEGDWDIPFWRTNGWPMSTLDLIDDDEGVWPVSPLSAGLPWEIAINELTQRALAKSQFNLRDIIIVMQNSGIKMSDDDIDKLLNGRDVEVITPEAVAQDAQAKDAIHHFQFNQISQEFERLIQLCEHYFEKATGLNEILYTGQGGSQFRNAASANLAAEASTSRVDEFIQRVELWTAEMADKESFAARILLSQADIAKVVGEEKAQAWRQLAPPRALQAAQLIEELPILAENPELLERMLESLQQGTTTLDEWVYEWSVEIVPGSTIRPSVQKQQQLAEWMMNQPFAAAMGAGDRTLALSMLGFAFEAHNAAPELEHMLERMLAMSAQPQPQQPQQPQQSQNTPQPLQ